MIEQGNGGKRKLIHVIDPCSKERAALANMAMALGYHAEIYSDHLDLSAHPPRDGIILCRDLIGEGGPAMQMDRFLKLGIWLPVVMTAEAPDPGRVVAAIKAGALDYLELPLTPQRLARCLARLENEATQVVMARKRVIEARSQLAVLTAREQEVLKLLAMGNSNKAIARQLDISPRTVEIHRSNLMAKLRASHSVEVIRLALDAQQSISMS